MSGPGNSNSKGEKTSEKDITYEGYLNDNYFKLISRETEHINNIEISHAIVKHPKTSFPGEIVIRKDGIYSQGGLIVLKIEKDENNKDELIKSEITLKCIDREGKQGIQTCSYSFKNIDDKDFTKNIFSSEAIEIGISLYYFLQCFKQVMKLDNNIKQLKENEKELNYICEKIYHPYGNLTKEELDRLEKQKIIDIKKEFELLDKIDKNEKEIVGLADVGKYDNFWKIGIFLTEHYKELEGLTENNRGDYLMTMIIYYQPSIIFLKKRKIFSY